LKSVVASAEENLNNLASGQVRGGGGRKGSSGEVVWWSIPRFSVEKTGQPSISRTAVQEVWGMLHSFGMLFYYLTLDFTYGDWELEELGRPRASQDAGICL